MPAPKSALVAGTRAYLRRPQLADTTAFVAAVRASARLHRNWVQAPATPARFAAYLRRFVGPESRRAATSTCVGLLACRVLRLHRVEINIQPSNERSIALVRGAGLTREGFSRRYVKIAGRWRDHERWALLAEDWRESRRRRR